MGERDNPMLFNPSDGTGVCDEINDICNTDNNSFPLTSKARRVNLALDRFFTLAFQADGRWTFDDVTRSNVPIESIDIVANQQSYNLNGFTSEIINVVRFESVDSNGNKVLLRRLKREDVEGALTAHQTPTATQPTPSNPMEYDLIGNFIYLYPKPNFSATNGLTVYMERNKLEMVSTYTTTPLGVPSIFNEYICRYASLPHLIETQRPSKNDIAGQIQQDEAAILNYFANREKGIKRQMTVGTVYNR